MQHQIEIDAEPLADITQQLKAALLDAYRVVLPVGTYFVSEPIRVPSNRVVVGYGRNTMLAASPSWTYAQWPKRGMLEIIRGPVHLEQIRDMRPEDLLVGNPSSLTKMKYRTRCEGKTCW